MKRFFWCFLVGALPIAAVVLFNFSVVYFSGEMLSYSEVIAAQQKNKSIHYGCVFNNHYASYKADLYRQREPTIVAVGSSRTLMFRQDFFTEQFANCGLAIRDLPTAIQFYEKVEEKPTAEIILLGLDQWWFNEKLGASPSPEPLFTGDELTFEKLFMPVYYWVDGRIDYMQVVRNHFSPEFVNGHVNIGLRAIGRDGGFRYDGSSLPDRYDIPGRPPIREFETVGMKLIRSQSRAYRYGKRIYPDTIDAFFAGVQRLRAKGIRVIAFFSPLAPYYYDYMQESGKYEYVTKLIDYTREKYGVYSYLDPASLGLETKDFMDLIHMRPAGYARLLRDLVAKEPELRKIVDMDAVEAMIEAAPPR